MSPLRLNGSTSGYSQIDAPAVAGDQTFTLPGTGGVVDTRNRAGNILQVVNATYSTEVNNLTSTFADTGLTATITPTSSSSKILITVQQAGCGKYSVNTRIELKLLRDSTDLIFFEKLGGYTNSTVETSFGTCGATYLDSPATTSATTYKTQFMSFSNTSGVAVQRGSSVSTITLMEVAA